MDAHAIVKGKVVITAWQRNTKVYYSKGIEYMRKTNTNKVIPKEVLAHMKTKGAKSKGKSKWKSKKGGVKKGAKGAKGVKSKGKSKGKSRGMICLNKNFPPLKRCT